MSDKLFVIAIWIIAFGSLLALGSFFVALASVPFGNGSLADPSGPVGKAAMIGLGIMLMGVVPLFLAMAIEGMAHD